MAVRESKFYKKDFWQTFKIMATFKYACLIMCIKKNNQILKNYFETSNLKFRL